MQLHRSGSIPGRPIAAGLALLLLTAGCQGSRHPELRRVEGRVLYQGQPVADAVVAFYNKDSPRAATGRTDGDGSFQLSTYDNNDGALPGEHTVVITKTSVADESPQLSMDAAVSARPDRSRVRQLLPRQYASVDSTPLRLEVKDEGPNAFTIELDEAE